MNATRIVLTLTHTESAVALSVRDDGPGLAAAFVEGAGITGMRERALLLGARLDVGAAPGAQGTEVRLVLAGAPQRAALP